MPVALAKILSIVTVLAQSQPTNTIATQWFGNNPNGISYQSIVNDLFRFVGFTLIKSAHWLMGKLVDGLSYAYEFMSFGSSNDMVTFVSGIKDKVFIPLMVVSLVVVGILLILSTNNGLKGSKVVQNIALSFAVFGCLPLILSELVGLTTTYVDANKSQILTEGTSNFANVTDYAYVFDNAATSYADVQKRLTEGFPTDTSLDNYLATIDINETIEESDKGDTSGYDLTKNWDVFAYKPAIPLTTTEGKTPTYIYKEVNYKGVMGTSIGTSKPYRYSFNFFEGIISYGIFIWVMFYTIIRCLILAYELAIKQIFAYVLAATDLASGRKLKFLLLNMLYTLVTLCYCITALLIFTYAIKYIDSGLKINGETANIIIRLLFKIVLAYGVVEGPNVLLQLFGIDGGLQNGYGMMDRFFRGQRNSMRHVKAIAGGISRASDRIADALGGGKKDRATAKAEGTGAKSGVGGAKEGGRNTAQTKGAGGKLDANTSVGANGSMASGSTQSVDRGGHKNRTPRTQSAQQKQSAVANEKRARANYEAAKKEQGMAQRELNNANASGDLSRIQQAQNRLNNAQQSVTRARAEANRYNTRAPRVQSGGANMPSSRGGSGSGNGGRTQTAKTAGGVVTSSSLNGSSNQNVGSASVPNAPINTMQNQNQNQNQKKGDNIL